MESNADNSFISGFGRDGNPLHRVMHLWNGGDSRVGADITSFIILVLFALSLVACDNSGEESVESSEVSDQETAESSTEVEESESAEVTEGSELESESEEETEGLSFTAGTYQGKGEGHNGSLVLDVTFTEEGLESIVVVSS